MKERAGLVAFYLDDDGSVLVRCMIPSDPSFGGVHPQLPKGVIDSGFSAFSTAIKEAQEEIGLVLSNMANIPEKLGVFTYGDCPLHVYIVEVKNKNTWREPHYETGWAGWVNLTHDFGKIREVQQEIFKEALQWVDNETS